MCLQFAEVVFITTWLTTSTVQYVRSKYTRQNHFWMFGTWSACAVKLIQLFCILSAIYI